MPRLMEKHDWMRTVADVGTADNVWYEMVRGDENNTASIVLPGMFKTQRYFKVILAPGEASAAVERPRRKSARDLIGIGRRKYGETRTTAEIMRELREGEDQ